MLATYCNQSITHKSKTSVDAYNQATYTPANIKARFEYKRKVVRNKKGEEVVSEARAYTMTAVKPDDVITYDSKDWTVISVSNMTDLDGVVTGYEVML